ncbi:MAG: PRC-barrel domain-containing protein [Clostridia bacterium]|nr:PRC-barrel domain-containing protein [Clostridia bacterium]
MIRLGSVTGLPVVWEGRTLGRVEQAALSHDGRRLRGLVIRRGFGSARWLGAGDVSVLGQVTVIAAGLPGRVPKDAEFLLESVRDTAGLELGRVTDVYLSPDSLRVTALEISLGPFEELTGGRLLAREFAVAPAAPGRGQVLIPTGCALERIRE